MADDDVAIEMHLKSQTDADDDEDGIDDGPHFTADNTPNRFENGMASHIHCVSEKNKTPNSCP